VVELAALAGGMGQLGRDDRAGVDPMGAFVD
jgi:hypothetical protein